MIWGSAVILTGKESAALTGFAPRVFRMMEKGQSWQSYR
jgi:hypothetical protein